MAVMLRSLLNRKSSNKKSSYKKGLWAEIIAALYLMCKGYIIIKHRFKTPIGEIDLIAKKGDEIIFIEVKHRSHLSDMRTGLYAITAKSQQRISRAADYFLQKNQKNQSNAANPSGQAIRFDAIVISLPLRIFHLKNAW